MLPIVAALLEGGFSLLGNAVLAKGKDVIEEKLGVNLESSMGSEEGRIKLKQLEMDNEEDLRQFILAKREQELRSDEMYLQDTQSARNMQIEALKQSDVFSKRFVYFFSIGWSVFTAFYVTLITFSSVPKDSVRFADTILGFLLGTVIASMFNFFLGSSKSSQDKDAVNAGMINKVMDGINK